MYIVYDLIPFLYFLEIKDFKQLLQANWIRSLIKGDVY